MKICIELLKLMQQHEDTVKKQNAIIRKFANENAELENMLNTLTDEYCEP